MNVRLVLKTLGQLVATLALLMGVALPWSRGGPGGDLVPLLEAMLIAGLLALALLLPSWRTRGLLGRREAFAVVSFAWLVAAVVGALPFWLSGVIPDWPGAFFEAMSGFTTTGASVVEDIESWPRGLLLWRSFTHWLGGMGIVVLFIAILPELGVGGRQLFRSEVPGPTSDGLSPRIQQTARWLWMIYTGLTLAETLALMLAGLDLFEALCHTFGTVATGGFSTRAASVAAYQSPAVEAIILVFMVLAGANFGVYHQVLWRRSASLLKGGEMKLYGWLLGGGTLLVALSLVLGRDETPLGALRWASFQVTSVMTTTGYGSADFAEWPAFAQGVLVTLMLVGGCSGSTGGGMKVVRVLLMARLAAKQLLLSFKPEAVTRVRAGGRAVAPAVLGAVAVFVVVFTSLLVFGTLVLSAAGIDLVTSFSASVATLSNIGPGLELVGPTCNYGWMPSWIKLFLASYMLLGRLELFTVLVLLLPSFWRK